MPIRWHCPTAVLTRVYTTKSDVYSFGVLLYEIYSGGATPFGKLLTAEVLQAVQAGERLARPRQDAPEDMVVLMRQCTTLDVAQRPSMASVHARLCLRGDAHDDDGDIDTGVTSTTESSL